MFKVNHSYGGAGVLLGSEHIDNIWQSLISMNQHPLHIESEYANQTEFKEMLVSSLVTFNIVNGLTVHSISQEAVAYLGWDSVRRTILVPVRNAPA